LLRQQAASIFEGLMANDGKKRKARAEIANELEQFAELLDPHLSVSSEVKEPGSPKRWSALKAAVYIFGTSIIVWALMLSLFYYLFWR
jgi:hypothetical protein